MSSTHLSRNIIYNLVGTLAPIGIMILTVPIYLRAIGPARFGVMSLIWLLFGYFGLFDFGLSRATANRLAQMRGEPASVRAPVFYTSLLVNAGIGLALGILFWLIARPLIMHLSPGVGVIRSELPEALSWFSGLFPLALVGNVFIGTLEADERFLNVNIQQLIGTIGLQLLPLAAVKLLGVDLQNAAIGACLARGLSVLWSGVAAVGDFRGVKPSIDLSISKSLLRYGGWVAVTNAVSPVLESVDQFVIGALLGPAAIGQYSVPYSVATKILILPAALSRAMFPRLSGLGREQADILANRAFKLLAWAMTLGCAPAILAAPFAFRIWLGPNLGIECAPIAQILLVGLWVNGMAFLPYTLLQGQGRPDLVAKFHLVEVLPFLCLLWVGIKTAGLPGAAAAWSFRVTLDFILLFAGVGTLKTSLRELVPMAAMMFLSGIASAGVQARPVLGLILAVVDVPIICLLCVAVDTHIRREALAIASRLVGRPA